MMKLRHQNHQVAEADFEGSDSAGFKIDNTQIKKRMELAIKLGITQILCRRQVHHGVNEIDDLNFKLKSGFNYVIMRSLSRL